MLRSLISVADTGSVTETARRLGRSQPAISLQIQRLEDLTGKALFHHEGRRMQLTSDGDMVLAYAKSILRLHDELLSRLSSPELQGTSCSARPTSMPPTCCRRSLRYSKRHFRGSKSSCAARCPHRPWTACKRAKSTSRSSLA